MINCRPRDAGSTAQSSPMPNGARGDAEPSQRRIARMSFSSPSDATESDGCGANGCTRRRINDDGGKEAQKAKETRAKFAEEARQAVTPAKSRTMVWRLKSAWAIIAVAMRPVRS